LSVPTDISKENIVTGTTGKLTNREKVLYCTTTGIVCAVMIFSITTSPGEMPNSASCSSSTHRSFSAC
jgi:hypothetical protein